MKLKVDIDTKTFVRFWLVIIGFLLVGMLIYNARTALVLVGAAVFLAIALSKPVKRLSDKLPGNSQLAGTSVAFMTMIGLLGVLGVLVVPPVIDQSAKFAETVPGLIDTAKQQWYGVGDFVDKYNLQPQIDQAVQGIEDNLSNMAAGIGSGLLTGVGSLLAFIVNLVIVITMTFLMLLEGNRWIAGFWSLYKDKTRLVRDKRLANRMYNVTTGYINGQVAVAGIGAIFAGIATVVIGMLFATPVNLAFPIIAVTFLISMIPMFGSTIAGTIGALLLVLNNPIAGLVYGIYFIIYQQIENLRGWEDLRMCSLHFP
ncbi:hypothetical protein B7Z17_04605 [Candidatus Saccharibacteria bacterium 32-49-10]|nr:MAG: hypothetical protein B7Z17_04605 [Candidatus Saccharibacteria bacterium 32-49-10]